MVTKYHWKLLLHMNQIGDLTTGHHTTITSNSKLRTFYSIITRCLQGTSTLFLASGQHLLLLITTHHHFPPAHTCTTQLTQFLSATSLGEFLAYNMMELDLPVKFPRGWMPIMMSDSGTLTLWSSISCPIQTSNSNSIMCPSRNILQMESITFKISCRELGMEAGHMSPSSSILI